MKRIMIISFIIVTMMSLAAISQPAIAATYNCSTQYFIPTIECQALEELFNSTDGANWTIKTGWLNWSNPCNWYGITCNGGHVTRIELNENNLAGPIPTTMNNLSYLTYLSVYNNSLTGSIPPELGDLSALEFLSLTGNDLTGSIPSELGNLSNLTVLTLEDNLLTGSIPSQLGNLTKVVWLNLHRNKLTGGVPASLGSMTSLDHLFLFSNKLTGTLPMSLTSLTLDSFYYHDTLLCEPADPAYHTWTTSISSFAGTGVCVQDMFYSQAAYDGWVLETGENTNMGGLLNSTNLTCYIGDDAGNRQFRTILHFNTSRLPETAVITKASLQYKQQKIIGADLYATHGKVYLDIKKGFFSNNAALQSLDFQTPSSQQNAGYFVLIPSSLAYPLYRATIKTTALQYLNQAGTTQFRLRFGIDDDNDNTADYIKIFCGDMGVPFNRPVLRVWYYVP